MADVSLTIGGRAYQVGCRAGGEAHLREVGDVLDAKIEEAARALGELGEVRQLLLGALLIADELHELRNRPATAPLPGPVLPPGIVTALENLAERIEVLADGLEDGASTS